MLNERQDHDDPTARPPIKPEPARQVADANPTRAEDGRFQDVAGWLRRGGMRETLGR